MPPIRQPLILIPCLLSAIAAAAGCESIARQRDSKSEYRTIDAEPLRDTEVAKRFDEKGLAHLDVGELDQATEAFKQALNADVEYGPAHNNLGKVYFLQEDFYNAAWEFEYATRLMPRHAAPRNNLALVLERAGKLDEAVDRYREAVGLEDDNLNYRGNLARALVRRGDRTAEVRHLLEAIIATDNRPEWLVWAKRELSRMGE